MCSAHEQQSFGFVTGLQTSWREFLSWIRTGHAIHPLEPITTEYSEFLVLNTKIKLHCIHINPDLLRKSKILEFQSQEVKNKRTSVSDEYWFTKWNKPSRTVNCNCSFRKSLRLSLASSPDVNVIDVPPILRNNVPSSIQHKIKYLENFVESLIEITLQEAIQEFYIAKCRKNNSLGIVNLAFTLGEVHLESNNSSPPSKEANDNRFDEGVIEFKNNGTSSREKNDNNISSTLYNSSDFSQCKHKRNNVKKPLVLLLHGIGTCSDIWWIVIKSLVVKGYEIVAPDMLGHGYSSAPDKEKSYSFHNLLLQALAVFDNYVGFDENRKCILVGHSYGCSFATAVYHHRPGLVSQMILISGGGPTPLAPPVTYNELIHTACFQAMIQPLIFCGVNRSLFYSSRGKFFECADDVGAIPNHVLHNVTMGQNWPEGDAAFHRRIFVPTLLVHGLLDKYVTLVQECEMERTIPRSFLELIPNAGHMPMLETPEQLTHMIICFLDCWS
ncbi:hypothetical protein WA026_008952 [Henosepilachna vigintioctopunctata]|uniref:acylglycerol lipase n=1 Tax=Henosepilachna vigintioctopunctata TaxID=420089 RepID=A0AAW1VCW0_9CUCU